MLQLYPARKFAQMGSVETLLPVKQTVGTRGQLATLANAMANTSLFYRSRFIVRRHGQNERRNYRCHIP